MTFFIKVSEKLRMAPLPGNKQYRILGINTWKSRSEGHAKSAVFAAIKTGEYLLKAKEKVPHGEWENWLESTTSGVVFSGAAEQARRYMKLAKNKHLAFIVNDLDMEIWVAEIKTRARWKLGEN